MRSCVEEGRVMMTETYKELIERVKKVMKPQGLTVQGTFWLINEFLEWRESRPTQESKAEMKREER